MNWNASIGRGSNGFAGCACDIPSHSYQYSFAPNPNWSAFYAPAAEICEYLQGVAERFGVRRWVKTEHKVVNCRWDENVKKWWVVKYILIICANH